MFLTLSQSQLWTVSEGTTTRHHQALCISPTRFIVYSFKQCVFIHCWWHDTNESTFENSLICPALCPFWQKVKKPQNPIFDLYVKKKDSKYVIQFLVAVSDFSQVGQWLWKNLIWRYCKPFGQITVYISWHCTMCCLYNNIFASV